MNNFVSSREWWIGEKLYYKASKSQFINDYRINKVTIQHNCKKIDKNCDCLYSINVHNNIQRNKIIFDYGQPQNTIDKNNLSKAIDNSHINILLIDNDEDILYTFNTILKKQGYKVTAFSNSVEALNHFTEKGPFFYDLILMDIRMPGINGIQLYYNIRAINPYAKILLVSALDVVSELVDQMPGIIMKEIIRKPIKVEDFILKIKSTLDNSLI